MLQMSKLMYDLHITNTMPILHP